MSDFSFYDPPIEVAAGPERLPALTSRLKAYGLRPYPGTDSPDFAAPDPLLVDLASIDPVMIRRLGRARMIGCARQIVILGELSGEARLPEGTLILPQDSALAVLRSRLAALARRLQREQEATLRRQSALGLGVRMAPIDVDATPSLLYLAGTSPRFLSLQHGLVRRGVEVTAALSQRTASQYLETQRFTAALIDTANAPGQGASGTALNSERGDPVRLPLIVLSPIKGAFSASQLHILNQASEIVDPSGPDETVLDAIEAHCRRLHASTPLLPPPGLMLRLTDIVSGLFSRAFLEEHLPRQIGLSSRRGDPLCLVTLRLDGSATPGQLVQKKAGRIILGQIRDTDFPALYQPGLFMLSLPSTDYRGSLRLAERITSAFASSDQDGQSLSWRVTERRSHHNAGTLLAEALTGPFIRGDIAA